MRKSLYVALGVVATSLAIIGAILPGLPSTVFVLIALWAFAESSPRLHKWLHTIPLLRVPLRHAKLYQEERSIEAPIKAVAVVSAWISAALFLHTNGTRWWGVSIGLIVLASISMAFMLLTPTASRRRT